MSTAQDPRQGILPRCRVSEMQSQIVTGLIQARTPPGGSALKHNIVVSRSPESRQDGSGYWHLAGETTNRQSLGFDCPAGD
ncbi:hypothetical protein SK1NUM_30210 [Arachnia rubra]|nr:hypothetical protein SK1NUM_30210 [Arachnia rubra]